MPEFLVNPAVVVAGIAAMQVVFVVLMAKRYRRAGPNEVLVISGGQKGVRYVRGGGTFVWPILEREAVLSLEPVEVEFRYSPVRAQGGALAVEGAARVRIAGDDAAIRAAAERFLSKPREAVAEAARMGLERGLRAAAEAAPAAAIAAAREAFSRDAQAAAAPDLALMGLTIESLVLRRVDPA